MCECFGGVVYRIYFHYRDPCWQMRVTEDNGKGVAGHTETLKHISKSRSIQMYKIHNVLQHNSEQSGKETIETEPNTMKKKIRLIRK